ncbi:hypothetical protein [Thorsellia anophelis]|uniref:Uncharacterized protein n=1 Tax=Thorsellia anophelis DSM 18579 TaxID=1123402 RepID=A0A1I0CX50_9GAMM|nr:hypothetical protein [Thorsellia anophelis]SET24152.1 hypothetical protein SAMN02583745_01778 [Thorsellia anophelis DSM 18579]
MNYSAGTQRSYLHTQFPKLTIPVTFQTRFLKDHYEYCQATGSEFLDFREAANRFSGNKFAFDEAGKAALSNISISAQLYDVILTDEVQDFHQAF